jgi:hypothetical protein
MDVDQTKHLSKGWVMSLIGPMGLIGLIGQMGVLWMRLAQT